jgi:hypothetical protein
MEGASGSCGQNLAPSGDLNTPGQKGNFLKLKAFGQLVRYLKLIPELFPEKGSIFAAVHLPWLSASAMSFSPYHARLSSSKTTVWRRKSVCCCCCLFFDISNY